MRLFEVYNIPRNKMPQINKSHLDNYEQKLMVVDINKVTPSQTDRVPGLVDKTLAAFKAGEKELLDKPMVVDRDMNIVNGHHRYDALKKMGMTKVPVLKVDATLPELIDDFSHTTSNRPVKEAFNQPYPVKLNKSDDGDYDALVKLPDGTNMDILFTNHGGIWDMEFHRGGSQDVTGEGDAYRIFATMLSAVKQFIRTEKPRIVSFQATKDVDPNDANPESRAKLYNRMVDKFANALGYNASVDDYGDTVEYELVANNLDEATDIVNTSAGHVLLSDYVKNHISTHNKPGMGSVFSQSVNFKELMNQISRIPLQGNGGAYTIDLPRAGYNLVLPIEDAKRLPGAKVTNVKKDERGGAVTVPAITTTAPMEKFATNKLTVVVRPTNPDYLPDDVKQNKEIADAIKQGKSYSVVTAFPGDELPPASQWNGKYAVIVPSASVGEGNKAQKGIPANATDAELRSARKAGGAKGKRAHWLLNMRKGNRKRKKS